MILSEKVLDTKSTKMLSKKKILVMGLPGSGKTTLAGISHQRVELDKLIE